MSKQWENAYNEAIRCIRCGYCQPTCPTYVISGMENSVARGRNYLARLLHDQEVALSKDYKNPLFECLLCGACLQNCAPIVDTPQIMMAARAEYMKKQGQPLLLQFIFRDLLLNPKKMTRLMKLASFGKRSGISGLAQALRVFGWFGKNIANLEGLLKALPIKFLRERLHEVVPAQNARQLKIGYFVGCGINYAFPDVGLATLNLLAKNNFKGEVLDNFCCGLPAAGYGDTEAAIIMAKNNIGIAEKSGCDFVMSECASCSSFLKEYRHLLAGDDDWLQRAQSFSEKVIDINVLLTQFDLQTAFKANEQLSVTFHEPCHLSHYLKIKNEPLELIRKIEQVELREMSESNWCCGGAGTYNVAHYDLSMKILKRKMDNVKKTDAAILLSSCPGCLVQLSYGARKFNVPVTVKHLVQLLNESMISHK